MKKLVVRYLSNFFGPEQFNDLDIASITEAFNDPGVRALWLRDIFQELKAIHLEVDKCLLANLTYRLSDLCTRRRVYQDILESILSAKRQVTQEARPNPKPRPVVDLDRVTA